MTNRRRTDHNRLFTTMLGKPDWFFLMSVLLLLGFGLLMVYEASAVDAFRDFGDRFHYLREQTRWLGIGLLSMTILSFFPYKKLYNLALPLLLGCMILLIAVFIPGIGIKAYGAHRWLSLGIISIQPSELTKLALVIYLSAWFSHPEKGRMGSFLLLLGMVGGLVILQPDLGTAILILAVGFILYFVSGATIKQIAMLIPIGLSAITGLSMLAPYRFKRILTFFNPTLDPQGSSYHIRQILISIGSGGWFGVGLGNSLQKYSYLPEATSDSIFAIISEELGFVGGILTIVVLLFLLKRGFSIAQNTPDRFGRLLAIGLVSWIGLQAAVNLSSMVALLPLTGIPFPFISYGGSSIIALLSGVGILLNISRHKSW